MPTTTYTDSPMLRSLLVGTLAALGLVGSAAAGGAAASCAPSPKGPEAYLLQARRLYPTAAWCGLTNSLVDAFLDPAAVAADRPVPQGRIRWHHVPGMRNVRDIGGWNGLPTGRVFRGSEPDCLPVEQVGEKRFHRLGVTEAGLRTMRETLKIQTDLDLRAASECPHPDVSALGVRLVRVPLGAYLGAFTATNQYAQALRVFAVRGNYPIYFHCWGGADRTGTLAYLVEGLCGVSEADLAVDYELTSFARVFGLRRRTGTPHPETGRPECAFPAFVARLKGYPGGTMAEKIAAYMERTLGLAKAEIAAIRNNVMGEGTSVPDVRETVVRLEELDIHAFTEPTWETRPRAKRSVRDTPLTVGGITYENGVGLLVKDTILGDFFPGGKCRRFEVAFGLDARAHRDARAVLNVWGDERLLATSGEVGPGEAAREMKVDLAGVKVVRIEVTDAGVPNDGVCADLCEAKFVMEDGAEMLESPAPFSPQLGILTPASDGRPRINGPSLYGVRPGKVLLYRVPVSGEKPLAVTVEGLPEGTWFDAATSMLRGTTPMRKGDYPLTVTAKNARGVARRALTLVVGDRIGLTPPMGWNSWNCFAPNVSDARVRAQAEAMFRLGLVEHGWQYLVIDDYWERNEEKGRKPGFAHLAGPVRDADGNILLNARFPDMKALADHVHALGLKIGIYSSPGPKTCGRCEGSWMHEWRDARQYAAWGFDYLKYDFCSGGTVRFGRAPMNRLYPWLMMGKALKEQDRDIYYSLSGGGQGYAEQVYANAWRLTSDVFNSWPHIRRSMDAERVNWMYTRPSAWGDPDMLVLQTNGPKRGHRLTPNEQYTHISMWCLFAAPLMIGNDMTKMNDFTRSLLTNDEVLDVNQDPLGLCAACVQRPNGGRDEVWAKPMADGSIAAGILNLSYEPRRVKMCFKRLGMRGTWRVRDLWRQREEGLFENGYEVEIPGHATQLVRIWSAEGGHFDGDVQDIRDFAWMNEIAAYRPLKPQDGDCAGCGEHSAQARHVSEDNSDEMAATVEAEGKKGGK